MLEGAAPVSAMGDYSREVTSYARGRGRLSCRFQGYRPCQDPDALVAALGYDPDRDAENPSGSVFCSHGAGHPVPWDQVEEYMHIENAYDRGEEPEETYQPVVQRYTGSRNELNREELDAI